MLGLGKGAKTWGVPLIPGVWWLVVRRGAPFSRRYRQASPTSPLARAPTPAPLRHPPHLPCLQAVQERAAAEFRRSFDKYDWTKALAE